MATAVVEQPIAALVAEQQQPTAVAEKADDATDLKKGSKGVDTAEDEQILFSCNICYDVRRSGCLRRAWGGCGRRLGASARKRH